MKRYYKNRNSKYKKITVAKKKEKVNAHQLLYLDSLRSLDKHTAFVLHELKAPIQAIKAHLQVMRKILHNQDIFNQDERFILINTEIRRLQDLLKYFLQNKQETRMAELPVAAENAASLLRTLCTSYHITLTVEKPEHFPLIKVDEIGIHRILVNLLINAVQAMEKTGGDIRIYFLRKGARVSVVVENNGPAITCRPTEKVFDLHYTTKKDGNGIGLYASRELAREMRGDLTVTSSKNCTAFTLTLPRCR